MRYWLLSAEFAPDVAVNALFMSKTKFLSLFAFAVLMGWILQISLIIGLRHLPSRVPHVTHRLESYPRGEPIPNGPAAPSDKEFCAIYRSWMKRIAVAEYEKRPGAKKEVITFLEDGFDHLKGVNIQTEQRLTAQAMTLSAQGINDPVFQLYAGVIVKDPATKQKFLSQALTGFEQTTYPRFLAFMSAANLAKSLCDSKAKPDAINKIDDVALRYLEQGLNSADVPEDEMSALRWRLDAPSVTSLMSRRGADLVNVVEHSSAVAPWLKHYIAGQQFVKEAWKARGTGWSNTVTREGWLGFSKNLAFARENLTRSWELNPKDPAAASEMIAVAMGDGGSKVDMRRWFDRAVAAQMDFEQAYKSFTWGLRPRWHGSHEEMLEFGRECVATNRFDTVVPYHYVNIVREIASEETDQNAIYKQRDIADPARKVLAAYLKSDKPTFSPTYCHTVAAIVAYKAGDLQAARLEMKHLQFRPDPAPDLAEMQNMSEMLRKLRALRTSDEIQQVKLYR